MPERAPSDLSTQFPNLFIVGSLKCGTTAFHHYLRQHPAILMSEPKEPGYLSVPALGLTEGRVDPDYPGIRVWSRKDYLQLFRSDSPDIQYRGEASVQYTAWDYAAEVARIISENRRDARILYLVRDPFEHMVSHYLMRQRRGREKLSLTEALATNPRYLNPTRYSAHISPFLERFGPEQVQVVDNERIRADARGTTNGTFRWLGLSPLEHDEVFESRPNSGNRSVVPEWLETVLERLPAKKALYRVMNKDLRERLKSVAFPAPPRPLKRSELEKSLARLKPRLVEHRKRFEDLVEQDFSGWLSHQGDLDRALSRFRWALCD